MSEADHLLRVAIWQAHGQRCAYTGDPIRFQELELDHVIPKRLEKSPEQLEQILRELKLPSDFDIDSIENLLPSSGYTNRRKGSSIDHVRIAHGLALAREKASRVRQIRDELDRAALLVYGPGGRARVAGLLAAATRRAEHHIVADHVGLWIHERPGDEAQYIGNVADA